MTLSALQASAYLHLGSPDPAAMAGYCSGVMGMTTETQPDGAILLQGPARRLLLSKGRAKKLVQAGFAVRDREARLLTPASSASACPTASCPLAAR